MRLTLHHRTTYSFSAPIRLEPHVIRLRPRGDAAIRLLDFSLEIDPVPVVRAENLDIEGNSVTRGWFEGTTTRLTVEVRATVETLVTDPFRFLVAEPERALPYAYAPDRAERLRHYRRAPNAAHPAVRELALEVARESERDQATFPVVLARRLSRDIAVDIRPEGAPQPPETTVVERRGACRDVAVLFVECCRAMGLAARFVSGYLYSDGPEAHELHAWGEVYLTGGGWRGYDPSQGLAVADRHVTVAAAVDPVDAAPIAGTFRGDATASLESTVEIQAAPTGAAG